MAVDRTTQRYAKHIYCEALGFDAVEKWSKAHIVQIGVGGIGCASAQYLAASGVGQITLIDHDTISLDNLQRQILFNTEQVGQLKVAIAQQALSRLNPDIIINSCSQRLNQPLAEELFANADLIIDATDNFETRYLINQVALKLSKNLVMGAAIEMAGQWAVFNTADKSQPCYQCLYPKTQEQAGNCRSEGVFAPVVGVVGTQVALAALQLLHQGVSKPMRLYRFDATTLQTRSSIVVRDPSCTH